MRKDVVIIVATAYAIIGAPFFCVLNAQELQQKANERDNVLISVEHYAKISVFTAKCGNGDISRSSAICGGMLAHGAEMLGATIEQVLNSIKKGEESAQVMQCTIDNTDSVIMEMRGLDALARGSMKFN